MEPHPLLSSPFHPLLNWIPKNLQVIVEDPVSGCLPLSGVSMCERTRVCTLALPTLTDPLDPDRLPNRDL